MVNFGEVQRAQLAKSTLLTSTWCPWDLLRSVQMLKREWGAESNGNLPHLFNPCLRQNTLMMIIRVLGHVNIWGHWSPYEMIYDDYDYDSWGWMGSKFSRHLSYSWGKTPEKPQSGKLSRPGIESGPVRWETTMLPLNHSMVNI